MPFCKYCGATHDADAVFCTDCGKEIVKRKTQSKQAVQFKAEVHEVPLTAESDEMIRVDDGSRPYIPGDPITPEMHERTQKYMYNVGLYLTSLNVFKRLFRDSPEFFGEEEWALMETMLAEKYGLSDLSLFREKELPDFAAEQLQSQPATQKRNAKYTKRNTEYWSKFDKKKGNE